MRKREIDIHLFLNKSEFAELKKLSEETNLSKSQVLRHLLNHRILVETPDVDYKKYIRELRMIGNNLNQILVIARANGIFNSADLQKQLDALDQIEADMREEVLLIRQSRKWR
jgi:predicted ArsR family transcriptional regulator